MPVVCKIDYKRARMEAAGRSILLGIRDDTVLDQSGCSIDREKWKKWIYIYIIEMELTSLAYRLDVCYEGKREIFGLDINDGWHFH